VKQGSAEMPPLSSRSRQGESSCRATAWRGGRHSMLAEMADRLRRKASKSNTPSIRCAGRMPGHMNGVLAKRRPYDEVFELEDINSDSPRPMSLRDGANDVTNPAAKEIRPRRSTDPVLEV